MIITTENTNMKANLEITDSDGVVKPIVSVNCNLVKGGNNFNLNFTVINEGFLEDNVIAVQVEMDKFKLALNTKMIELGYKITI